MNFLDNVFSFIFPPVCGICGKIGKSYLCENCAKDLKQSSYYHNEIHKYEFTNINPNNKSKYISKNNLIHQNCKSIADNFYFQEHYYLFSYTALIREKIIQYKFHGQSYLFRMFFEFFVKNEKLCGFLEKYDIIIPVPISKNKMLQRGYNQSLLIAKEIAKRMKNVQLEDKVLIKQTENKPQSSLNRKQRLKNVKNVYNVQNEQKIKEKNLLLFDDIFTTGATVNECAKTLKQAGTNQIGVLTIAKDFQEEKQKTQTKGKQTWKI